MGNNHKKLEPACVSGRLREYEKVVEGLEEMIAIVDRDYRYLLANRAFLEHRAVAERDQIVGRLVPEVLDKDLFERVIRPKLDECFQGRVVKYEMTYCYPEIGERVLSITYLPINGPDGIDSVACVLHDITEKRQAEEFLRLSELQLVEAQHIAKIGSWTWDLQTNTRSWSEELYRIFGLDDGKSAPSLESALIECVHPDDREFVSSAIQTSINSKEPCSFFYRIIRPDGAERTIHSQGSVITDDSGNPIRMFGTAQDITDQRRAEDALREAEQKYRDIFENAGEGIFQTTPEGQYIAANPALAQMHGFDSAEELIGSLRDISREVYVDPAQREEFKRLIEPQGFVRGFEHQIFQRDGTRIWVSVNARAVRDKQGKILYYEGTTQDINERKLAEARSAAFATLARKLSGATTKLGAARIIAETARELFGWDSCNLDLYDADRDLVLPMLKVDILEGRRVEIADSSPGRKPTARSRRIIDHGPALILREDPIKFDKDTIPFGDTLKPSASIMTVPIRHASTVIGILSIQSYTPRAYSSQALSNLQSLSDHCGEALNRINAEESFYESEERFRQMAHNFEDVVWLTDRDMSKVLYINPAYERIFRRTCESVHERLTSFLDAIHPEDRVRVEDLLHRQRTGHHEPIEYRIVWPDESVRWILSRSFPIRSTQGDVYLVAAIAQDITERKRGEAALQESEERFRQLSEAAFEAIVLHDNGTILEVNQSFCRMYGYERAEVIGKSVLELTLPEFREPLRQRVRSGGAGSYDGLALRKDGTIFRAELAGKPIHYQGRAVRVAAIRDITEQKRNERRQVAQYAVTRVLAESATLAEATPQLLQVICESLRCKMGECWRKCDSTNFLRCVETWHMPALDATAFIEASRQTELTPGVDLAGRVWQNGQPAWIPDVMTDPRFARAEIAAKIGLRGAVAFPILLGNHTLGVMQFFSSRIPEVDEDLLKILSAIGSQIGQFTERKRAERAQREAERKYRDIFENAVEGIFQTTPEGGFITVNPALAHMLGYESPEELIRERRDIALQGYVDPKGREEFQRLLDTQDTIAFEHQIYRKDRTKIWISENVRAVRDDSRALLWYEGTAEDITERKRAEEALRQSEVYFRSLIEHAADTISTYDANGVRLYTSPSIERVLGYKPEEMIGRSGFELLHPDDRPLLAGLFAQGVQIRGTKVTKELRCRHKDGTWRTLESTASNLLGNPAVGAVVLNSRDITERRRAEAALRESEERYRDLVENSRELICTHDLDGLVLSANPAAAEALGYDLNDFVGKRNIRDILAPEARHQFDDYMARVRRDGESSGLMLVQTSSGERRLWEFYNSLRTEGVSTPIVRGMARDITERKRAEAALRQSEREYRELFENAHDAILIFSPEQEIVLEVNQRACDIYGISRSEFIGMSLKTISENAERGSSRINETLARGTFHNFETIQRRGDGTEMLLDVNSSVVQYNGETAIQSINRDITERKRAEEEMSNLRRELELTMNSMEEGVHRVDLEGKIVFENPAAARMLGWEVDQLLGKRGHPTMHHTRQDGTPYPIKECLIYASFRDGVSRHVTDEVFWRQDGTSFPVEYTTAPVRDDRNELVATVVTFRDITERKRAEDALRESEERYRELFENAKDAIYVHDLSGRYVSVNRAAEKLSGFTREEILGKHYSNFVAPRNLKHARTNLCMKLDEVNETIYEVFMITKDKRAVPVEVSSRLIHENGVPVGVQGIVRDITERNRAQEALQTYSRRLIEAQEAERQHIARELHDEIGQVLTAVKINLQSIQRLGPDSAWMPPLDESIGIVDEALGRVRELSIELRPSLLDDLGLSAALRWYVDRYAQRTGIRAEVINGFEEEGRLPRELETACFRIAQEALTNVVRHAKANSLSVQLERLRERLVLTISDDGVGFDVEGLFSNASTMAALGLRGMEERALAVNGKIEIESALQNGTRVRATFPFKRRK